MNDKETPNMNLIKGLIATVIGFMLLLFAYSIILRMIFFTCGVLLIYYGLNMLNIPAISKVLTTIKVQLQRFFK
jgi:hypothetical protein